MGKIVQFGLGTVVVLHGARPIITAAEGAAVAEAVKKAVGSCQA